MPITALYLLLYQRGVEQLVARRAHNPKVVGSSPASATRKSLRFYLGLFLCAGLKVFGKSLKTVVRRGSTKLSIRPRERNKTFIDAEDTSLIQVTRFNSDVIICEITFVMRTKSKIYSLWSCHGICSPEILINLCQPSH